MRASLSEPAPSSTAMEHLQYPEPVQTSVGDDVQWDNDANDVEFLDAGEGAGVEGDLDLEDD